MILYQKTTEIGNRAMELSTPRLRHNGTTNTQTDREGEGDWSGDDREAATDSVGSYADANHHDRSS